MPKKQSQQPRLSDVVKPNAGWWVVVAGFVANKFLERFNSPAWAEAVTLGLALFAAATWPWLEARRSRRRIFWTVTAGWAAILCVIALTARQPSPIRITEIALVTPQVGRPVGVTVKFSSTGAAPKIRSAGMVMVTVGPPLLDRFYSQPRELERELWAEYVKGADPNATQDIAAPDNDSISMVLDNGQPLTAQEVATFQSGRAVIFAMGQIDYGYGAVDFCVFAQPPTYQALYCLNNNGASVERRAAFVR